MVRRTFIRLQLRKSSYDRVQSVLVLFSSPYQIKKKFESISSNGSRDIAKSLKISFGSSFLSLRAFGSKFWQFRFPVYTFQTKKKPHSIISTRSWVLVYITFAHGRTDRHFSKNFSFFLLIKNIYTYIYSTDPCFFLKKSKKKIKIWRLAILII